LPGARARSGGAGPAGRAEGDTARPALPWLAAVALAAFVDAGNWKASPLLSAVPFDLTLGLAIVTSGIVLWYAFVAGIPRAVPIVVAGLMLLAPPLLWSYSTPYADEKSVHFFTLTALAALAPAVLVRRVDDARRLLTAFAGLSLLSVVNVIFDPRPVGTYAGAPDALPGVTTIAVGRSGGFVVLFAAAALIWKQRGTILWIAAGAVGVLAMLKSRSRGPLLSTAEALVATVLVLKLVFPRALVTLGLAALAVVALFARAPVYARERIESLVRGEVTGTVATRIQLFDAAWNSVGRSPLGLGWGGYERVGPTNYQYPHDLALEVLAEAGVLLGGLFLAWMLLYFVLVQDAGRDFTVSLIVASFTFALLNAMVSGDLNDNRELFMVLGIAVAVVHRAGTEAGPQARARRSSGASPPPTDPGR